MTILRALSATALSALLLAACAGGPGHLEARFEELAGYPEDAAADGAQLASVALFLDGERLTIAEACNGVDGDLVARTEGGATVELVHNEGSVLRYETEGVTTQYDVEVEQIRGSTVYRTIAAPDDVTAADVVLELGATTRLDDC